jgi:NADPH2:quinone reductase
MGLVELDLPEATGRTILVETTAAGVNFIDVYQRSGLYPVDLPLTLGLEGAGTVVAAGPDARFGPGDRVAWASAQGSYATHALIDSESAVAVPEVVDLKTAAAVMLQGMTAHYLTLDTYPLAPGERCLIHAGAGGVGLLLIQFAKMIGAEVFATVGSAEKAELATAAGADHVIKYRESDFGDEVERIAGPKALSVIYDGVGKATFERGLDLLHPRGMMVTFGNASGPVDPVSPLVLMQKGSLFLTRPTMFHYVAQRSELEKRAADLFEWIGAAKLHVRIGVSLPLAEAAQAHRLLETRQTTGKVILTP